MKPKTATIAKEILASRPCTCRDNRTTCPRHRAVRAIQSQHAQTYPVLRGFNVVRVTE